MALKDTDSSSRVKRERDDDGSEVSSRKKVNKSEKPDVIDLLSDDEDGDA